MEVIYFLPLFLSDSVFSEVWMVKFPDSNEQILVSHRNCRAIAVWCSDSTAAENMAMHKGFH